MAKREKTDQQPPTQDEQVIRSNQLLSMIRERMARRKNSGAEQQMEKLNRGKGQSEEG